jgi:hypothetical protein
VNQTDTRSTLESIEGLRDRTHRLAHPSWLPLFVFGLLVLGAVPFALAGDSGWDGYYWLAAGPLGGIIAWRLVAHRGVSIGLIDRRAGTYAAIVAVMVAGALVVGWAGADSDFSNAGTAYPIAAGMAAIAVIARVAVIGAAAAGIAAWATAVLIADPAEIAAWTYAGEGAILIAAGLLTLVRAHAAGGTRSPGAAMGA